MWAVDVLRHNQDHQCKTTKTSNISTEIFETKTVFLIDDLVYIGGTGVSELTRGLATLPPRWIQEPVVVRDRDGRPQEDPLAVHCFCVCSGVYCWGSPWGKQIKGT